MLRLISTYLLLLFWLTGMIFNGCQKSVEESDRSESRYRVSDFMSGKDTAHYKRADKPQTLKFPRDLGTHPDYKTEWWYYTGNLSTENGRRFGYELTIFRSGLEPDSLEVGVDSSPWRSRHLYMAHLALTDVSNGKFYSFEHYSRGAAGLAGARAAPFEVWLENWQVKEVEESADSSRQLPVMLLQAQANPISLDLKLNPVKPLVLQGDEGLDQKGPEPGNASYYFSATRIQSEGTLTIHDRNYEVTGWSWMDREWSTSALGENQVGWDWFALQLSDKREIMYYRLRNKDGTISTYSNGIIVDSAGRKTQIDHASITVDPLAYWTSPTTGARYPVRWSMKIPEYDIDLEIIPLLENQELQTRFKYWEGAVKITGIYQKKPVSGYGYVELTGYGNEMKGGR